MGRVSCLRFVPALGLILAAIAMPPVALAEDGDKEDKSGVDWKPLLVINAKAPSAANATYVASKEVKVTEQALRFKVKISSNEGKGGNMTITLYKLNKPTRKITVMKQNRDGEKEVAMRVEPGDYKVEISVNNVSATATIDEGSKKK